MAERTLDGQTGNRHPVAQWFIARRFFPLVGLVGVAVGWAIVVICEALGIPAEAVLFGVLMFALGLKGPREVTRLQAHFRRTR